MLPKALREPVDFSDGYFGTGEIYRQMAEHYLAAQPSQKRGL